MNEDIYVQDIELILLRSLVERGENCEEAANLIYKYIVDNSK